MKEKTLQAKIIDYCKTNGIYLINVYGSGMTAKGAPDLIGCYNGVFLAIECKVGKNVLSPAQQIHKKRILEAGGVHLTPYTLEEFITELEAVRKWLIKNT